MENNTYLNLKNINKYFGKFHVLKDINIYIKNILQIILGVRSYIGLAKLFKIDSLSYLISLLKSMHKGGKQ